MFVLHGCCSPIEKGSVGVLQGEIFPACVTQKARLDNHDGFTGFTCLIQLFFSFITLLFASGVYVSEGQK